MHGAKVLIVDADRSVADAICGHLTRQGFLPMCAYGGEEALRLFPEYLPQAVILREGMPGLSGLEAAQHIRQMSDVPLLFISERSDRFIMERALRVGDDFMARPWSWERLTAKLTALLKRSPASGRQLLGYDDGLLSIDFAKRTVSKRGQAVHLTETEFRLLSYFVRNANRVLKYDELLANVWDHTYLKAKSHVSVYVGYLRKKIEDNPSHPIYLCTERGLGYSFRSRAAASQAADV